MTAKQMIDAIRTVISQCTDSERATYEALVDEASGWQMRLEELEEEDEDT